MASASTLADAAQNAPLGFSTPRQSDDDGPSSWDDDSTERAAARSVHEGKRVFRYDTFGDEAWWGQKLRLHQAIAGADGGGVGPGVSPRTALSLGLKVNVDALPLSLRREIRAGHVDLDDPAITVALLKLNAVVGVTGFFDDKGVINNLGLQCAFCHSTVDDSFAPGIGHPQDGWPNRDLDVGGIVAAAPDLSAYASPLGVTEDTVRTVLKGWGRGKFDAFLMLDGKATRLDGGSAATLIPALFDLRPSGLVTWNGWSGIAAWVPLVVNLELHGQGVFSDRRLTDPVQFPVAAAQGYARIVNSPDLATSKLPPLLAYVEAIQAPKPPIGSFDSALAAQGEALFTGKARCSGCHVPPINTTPGWNVVPAAVIGIDSFQADRSPNHGYRPPPLHALFAQTKGGFFHDGRFATLGDVVAHFDAQFKTGLTADERGQLVEYLKSL